MRTIRLITISTAIGCALSFAATSQKVELQNAKGESVGSATITPAEKGIKIKLNLIDLPPGEHGIHIHQKASCEAPDFKTAGGHFNPTNQHHGAHAGDLGNFKVGKSGKSKFTVLDPNVNLGGDENSVYAGGGTSLVIHEKVDDLKTDPSGNSGARIACGVIVK